MNLQESIRRILRESLESEWNEGNYDYQHGFCHYFAYNIIDKIRERFPNKKVNYYLLLANEVNKDTDEVEQDYLLHVYIKIGDKLLDSNGFTTMDEVEERVDDWYNRQLTMTPEEYEINVWEEESDEIPKMFFNNRFCNIKRVKEDMDKFLSHPSVQKLLKDTLNESDESRQERKFTKLLNNIEEYINSNSYNSVVRVMVDYDEVMDDVIVNIFFDAEHAVKLGGGINSVIKKSGKKIMEDLSVFPFDFKYHIHFEKPQLNESRTNSSLNNLLNMLFDGFDDIYYDWANYMCGMGECCDPYAIGFTLPKNHYDDYIFKLVDSVNYDDDGDYSKELRDELPEVCYESPDLKNPDFDTIVFYGLYAEEIEDYMGPESNWRSDLLKLINKKFGCEAKQIIII